MDLLLFLGLALALGFKHSYDADHLVAVSTVLTRAPGSRRALWLGLSWAAGHMITAAVITIFLFLAKEYTGLAALAGFETAVAVMLVVIGALALALEYPPIRRRWNALFHRHEHEHAGSRHDHAHPHLRRPSREHGLMLGIGLVHGLASNDEILILLLPALAVTSLAPLLAGIGVFSLGVVLGMVLFAWAVTYPTRRWSTEKVQRAVRVAAAVLSLIYGIALLLGYPGFNPFG